MVLGLCDSFSKLFGKLWYVVVYYVIGAKAILHDLLYKRYNHVVLRDKPHYVAVVTGGARGIGSGVVKKLLQCDMHVVIGCMNVKNGEATVQNIRDNGVKKGSASVYELNLKSLKSVQEFAAEVNARHEYVNLLVNNAGIMFGPYEETEDGFESQFAVNYLGHFLLTHLLLPAMKRASTKFDSNPRIVTVSSCAHVVSPNINFADINMKKNYIEQAAYAQSKLCELMFAKALNRHLKESGSNIQSIALHPGIVNTELFNGTLLKILAPWVLSIFCKSVDQGAATVTYCCIDEEAENAGGAYYSNCCRVSCLDSAEDVTLQEQLYKFSIDAVKRYLPKKE